ncbi:serine/threonine-protein kinase [Promicromonospora iranensis]|uniref:non-specific serine/threonine protein kinase n=1 Tax=Promicromonospora iranensis TaxID=1105144 RepID=A0ABU2CPT6_9MICO|nr:serine/threonine-protein kinase [Promicromonospora iranensis]MDR7383281.1 serine/threonine-protein kinase [Promicromonospora iranensis]
MRPVEGLTLGERYTLVRRIAMGGMGEVWVARDEKLAREIAVKVLREEYTGNEDFLRRLRTEARNSSTLVHPNIAQMFDYGEERGAGYLVMELVLGEPLADLLEREPVLPPARLLPILAQTARGLHAAHLAGVVHRDVKPGNILLEHSGTVKITDFGVSVAQNQVPMTATGMVMGTAQYLSPEQAVGQSATGASDIYALGVVAYEATAGRRPFTGRTPVDIAIAHVNAPVPLLPTSVHPGLAETITQMLEKDPAQRISSADQLARHLDVLAAEIAEDPFGSSRYARRARRDGPPSAPQRSNNGRSGAAPQPGPSHARRQTPFGQSSGGRHTTVANAQSAPPSPDRGTPAGGYGSGTPAGGYGSGPFGSGAHGSDSAGYGTTSGTHGTDAYGRPYSPAPGTPAGGPGSGQYGTDSAGYGADSAGYGTTSGAFGTDAYGRPHGSGYVPPPSGTAAGNGARSYPSRRDLHSTRQDGRKVPQQGRSGGHPGKRRSLSSDIQRWVGGIEDRIGVRVSWPLVALVALLLVVLIITLVTGGGDNSALQEPWGSSEIHAEMLNPPAAAAVAASGMMLFNEPYALRQTAMTSKDV